MMAKQSAPDARPDCSGLVSRRPRNADGEVVAIDAPIDPFMLALRDDVLSGWYDSESKELAPGFPVSPDDLIADIGCGEGGMSKFCVRMGARVVMIDSDADTLARAVEETTAMGAGLAEGRAGDVERIPLADASATRIICCEVLEHVDDPVSAMRELVRVGAPGSLFLLTVPGARSERLMRGVAPPHYFQRPNHIRIFEADELAKLVEDSGLTIEHRFSYGFFWTMYWLFFYQAGIEFGRHSHPLLDAWTQTWRAALDSQHASQIRAGLNELAPRSIGIVARKPA